MTQKSDAEILKDYVKNLSDDKLKALLKIVQPSIAIENEEYLNVANAYEMGYTTTPIQSNNQHSISETFEYDKQEYCITWFPCGEINIDKTI